MGGEYKSWFCVLLCRCVGPVFCYGLIQGEHRGIHKMMFIDEQVISVMQESKLVI